MTSPHGRQTFVCTCVRNVQTELQTAYAAASVDYMTINWSAMGRCKRHCSLVRMLGPMWRTRDSPGRRRVQQRSGLCPRQLSSIRLYKRGGVWIVGPLLLMLASSSGWAGFNVAAAATVKIGGFLCISSQCLICKSSFMPSLILNIPPFTSSSTLFGECP